MPKRRRNKKLPSIAFEAAREYVGNIMALIRDAIEAHGIEEYEESDNGTEMTIPCDNASYVNTLYGIIKSETGVPEKTLNCLVDIQYSAVSHRIFIRLKRK